MRTVTLASLILVASTAVAAAQDAIKFGYPQTPAGALAVVADKTELWARNGLKVQSISFASGVNARDGNNVPGCPKPDKLDAVWLAKLTEKGILRLSSVLPVQVRQLRDYTRSRVDVPAGQGPQAARRRADQYRPWGREDSMSARDTLEALIAGDRDSSLFANLARGKMRPNGQRSPRR